ncbi:sugar phosphate isomerase/epimerase family protein [Novosphingobium resinovorum]|uniref:sugar phosphate isomerase/epimerase family protein n=1 Tax=Novosphingobium resinovorum TaxID=158500 RepID=UPI002ED25555|nr:TIM barrel protein [Novosphingobium resinovorum]
MTLRRPCHADTHPDRRRVLALAAGAIGAAIAVPGADARAQLGAGLPAAPAARAAGRQAGHGRDRHGRDRIALTTVSLRALVALHGRTGPQAPLALVDTPRFVRKTFGLAHVELWSLQFAAETDAYCAALGQAARAQGCPICNIQLDGPYDLSHPDPARRTGAEAYAMGWVRRAAIAGSAAIRINTDAGAPGERLDPGVLVAPLRRIADYGAALGVRILVENHIGASRDIPALARLADAVDHPNLATLADWGNSPEPDFRARLADLALLTPRLGLVSAKGLHFDGAGTHVEYPFAPLVAATEAAGYRGLYSIELFTTDAPPDPLPAIRAMIAGIENALIAPTTPATTPATRILP